MERRSFSMQVTKLASASLGRMKATTLRCTASQTSDAEVSAFTLRYGNWLTLDRHRRIVETGRVDPGIGGARLEVRFIVLINGVRQLRNTLVVKRGRFNVERRLRSGFHRMHPH